MVLGVIPPRSANLKLFSPIQGFSPACGASQNVSLSFLDVVEDQLSVFPRAQSPNNPSSLDRMTSSSFWSAYYFCMVHIDTGGRKEKKSRN